ncbi:MAG: heparan-alpha-glucosaminide N-acetyltransferase domain-containing protein, partial [Acidobacteriaceae bacterium]
MTSQLTTHLPGAQTFYAPSLPQASNRLLSLDLLRGLTIAFMILVNDAGDFGSAYWPLLHSRWNGCTPTDIVFPTFLFIIGITTVISTSSRLSRGVPRRQLFLQIVRRAIILFLLGIVVNSFPFFNPHTMRFFGILPRISVCYFVVATLYLFSQGWRDK